MKLPAQSCHVRSIIRIIDYLFVQCELVSERSSATEVNFQSHQFTVGVNVIARFFFDDRRSYNGEDRSTIIEFSFELKYLAL